eukprot:scaffold6082_cov62-Attheya_sp.AAC.2
MIRGGSYYHVGREYRPSEKSMYWAMYVFFPVQADCLLVVNSITSQPCTESTYDATPLTKRLSMPTVTQTQD